VYLYSTSLRSVSNVLPLPVHERIRGVFATMRYINWRLHYTTLALISTSQTYSQASANTARLQKRADPAGVLCDMPSYSPSFRRVLIPA